MGKLLVRSELPVNETSVQPDTWTRSESSSQPGQVPCKDFMSSQRSGAAAGDGAGGAASGAGTVCPSDSAAIRRMPGAMTLPRVCQSHQDLSAIRLNGEKAAEPAGADKLAFLSE